VSSLANIVELRKCHVLMVKKTAWLDGKENVMFLW